MLLGVSEMNRPTNNTMPMGVSPSLTLVLAIGISSLKNEEIKMPDTLKLEKDIDTSIKCLIAKSKKDDKDIIALAKQLKASNAESTKLKEELRKLNNSYLIIKEKVKTFNVAFKSLTE